MASDTNTIATVSVHGDTLELAGTVVFDNVVVLTKQGQELLLKNNCKHINLSKIQQFDSSILALLTAWVRFASDLKTPKFKIINRPKLLADLSRVCELETILPWA